MNAKQGDIFSEKIRFQPELLLETERVGNDKGKLEKCSHLLCPQWPNQRMVLVWNALYYLRKSGLGYYQPKWILGY